MKGSHFLCQFSKGYTGMSLTSTIRSKNTRLANLLCAPTPWTEYFKYFLWSKDQRSSECHIPTLRSWFRASVSTLLPYKTSNLYKESITNTVTLLVYPIPVSIAYMYLYMNNIKHLTRVPVHATTPMIHLLLRRFPSHQLWKFDILMPLVLFLFD